MENWKWSIGSYLERCLVGGEGSRKIATPCSFLSPEAKVYELFDSSGKSWNINMIKTLFLPVDLERILSVPFSACEVDDDRIWYGNSEGTFKVKEAYMIAMAMEDNASCSKGADPMWKKLWRLNDPPKAKIFLWLSIWDIIPHSGNLQRKGVLELGRCPRCGEYESSIHAFRDCSSVRKFWSIAPTMICKNDSPDIRTWFTNILITNNIFNAELLTILLWQIWFARNKLCFEKIFTSPEICFERAKDGLLEYQRWNYLAGNKVPSEKGRWSSPSSGSIKLNFDASINQQRECYGLGVIARDEKGLVLLTASKTQWPLISAEMAELRDAEWAILLAINQQWKDIIIDCDAYLIIEALKKEKVRGLHSQVIINNIHSLCNTFSSISFSFCYKECNKAAHRLARWASSRSCENVWLDSSPIWIKDIVIADSSS